MYVSLIDNNYRSSWQWTYRFFVVGKKSFRFTTETESNLRKFTPVRLHYTASRHSMCNSIILWRRCIAVCATPKKPKQRDLLVWLFGVMLNSDRIQIRFFYAYDFIIYVVNNMVDLCFIATADE